MACLMSSEVTDCMVQDKASSAGVKSNIQHANQNSCSASVCNVCNVCVWTLDIMHLDKCICTDLHLLIQLVFLKWTLPHYYSCNHDFCLIHKNNYHWSCWSNGSIFHNISVIFLKSRCRVKRQCLSVLSAHAAGPVSS